MVNACWGLFHVKTSKEIDDGMKKEPCPLCSCCCCCFCFFHFHPAPPSSPTGAIHHVEPPKSGNSPTSSESKRTESVAAFLVPVVVETPPIAPSSCPRPAKKKTEGKNGMPPKGLNNLTREGKRSKRYINLIRASSSNVMLFGNLGNVMGRKNSDITRDVLDYLPKTAEELSAEANANKKVMKEIEVVSQDKSNVLNAEGLKEKGNEEYKKGRYSEAVALYEKAISEDPNKASYWSNKAAALLGLGKILEAVSDCRTAVRIEPSYDRAHNRLGTLCLRLGDADGAVNHYMLSRNEASRDDMLRAKTLRTQLLMSDQAQRVKDWAALLKATQGAISAGADSAPQVFALQAEALLNLQRHEEAVAALASSPKFDIDSSTKFFGAVSTAYVLGVTSQVNVAAGRFEDAVTAAEKAAQLDPDNRDICFLAHKALAVTSAWLKGNDLFKDSRFSDACIAYGEGLEHDPYNAILLCNRAACQSELGQCEKAIEDCNTALKFRPSYSTARLRKAGSNAKLGRWEQSIEDYEVLLRQMPGDDEVVEALFVAHAQLKKQPGKEVKDSESNLGLSDQ